MLIKDYYTGIHKIFNHYGVEKQKQQLIQELAELILAITKNDEVNIIEEISDVMVMLDEFMAYNDYYSKTWEIRLQKVERQLTKIESEKNGKI